MPIRILLARPVEGGDRFEALIGPVPPLATATRGLLAGALASGAVGALAGARGASAAPWLAAAGVLLALSVGLAALVGGRERLTAAAGRVGVVRAGPFGPRRRSVNVEDVRRVRPGRGGGIALETEDGVPLVAGRGLDRASSLRLAESLQRHLARGLRGADAAALATALGGPLAPRSAPHRAPASERVRQRARPRR